MFMAKINIMNITSFTSTRRWEVEYILKEGCLENIYNSFIRESNFAGLKRSVVLQSEELRQSFSNLALIYHNPNEVMRLPGIFP